VVPVHIGINGRTTGKAEVSVVCLIGEVRLNMVKTVALGRGANLTAKKMDERLK